MNQILKSDNMDELADRLAFNKEAQIITLADLNKYFDDQGFVGDESTRLGLSIAIIRRKAVGVVSGAGTGKSAVVDTTLKLFKEQQIYKMGAGSNAAQAYNANKINAADLIYITELQKMASGDVALEMLKDLGEGKDYKREVVKHGGNSPNMQQKIKKGKAIVYTKAIENDFKTDDELQRRYPNFTTDMSSDQNRKVIISKAGKRGQPFKDAKLSTLEKFNLQKHMSDLLAEDANNYTFVNPMAEFLAVSIPHTFAISRSYTDHYFDLVEGVAFFNKQQRMCVEIDHNGKKKKVIFVTPEDVWQLHKIYWTQFLQDVMNLPPNGIKVIDAFKYAKKQGIKSEVKSGGFFAEDSKDDTTKLTMRQIFNVMKEMGIVLKENVIKKIIDSLKESGYVNEDISGTGNKANPEYYLNDEVINFEEFIDWDDCIKECIDYMKENYPDHADAYIDKYCTSPRAINPLDGESILINSFNNAPIKQDVRDDWMDEDYDE